MYAIGLNIGGTTCSASLIDTRAWAIRDRQSFASLPAFPDFLRQAIATVSGLLARASLTQDDLLCVGISCGGPLDLKRGLVLSPPHLAAWDEVPIVDTVSRTFGCPAYLENDANAGALAEYFWGAGQGVRDLVFVTFGTGFGAGIIADGRLIRGCTGQAGEIGHLRLRDTGPVAYGKAGSVEAYCSGGGIRGRYGCSAADLFTAAHRGDAQACRRVAELGRDVGHALALIVDLVNPELIVLGGIYARQEEMLRDPIRAAITAEALPISGRDVRLAPARLGDQIGDYATMAILRYTTLA